MATLVFLLLAYLAVSLGRGWRDYKGLPSNMSACIDQAAGSGARRKPADIRENLSTRVALRRYFLYEDWETISEANGFYLLTDGIHMNDKGASLTAGLIERWLRNRVP